MLHAWHIHIDQQLDFDGLEIWSTKYLSEYSKFAISIALYFMTSLGETHFALEPRRRKASIVFFQWQTRIQNFGLWHQLGDWLHAAQNTHVAVSSPQCSPTSTPQTASRQRRLRSSTRIKFVPFSPPSSLKILSG